MSLNKFMLMLFSYVFMASCSSDDKNDVSNIPIASFEASALDIEKGGNVLFTDKSLGGEIVRWSWDFNDGDTSDMQNPEHVFQETGDYDVSLTVEDDKGQESVPFIKTISVMKPAMTTPKILWVYQNDERSYQGSPAVSNDGTVIFGDEGSRVVAVKDGNLIWDHKFSSVTHAVPAIDEDGIVYYGSHDKNLGAWSTEGDEQWIIETPTKMTYSSPALASNGTIYSAGQAPNKVFAVDHQGNLIWDYEGNSRINGSPIINKNETVVYVGSDKSFLAIDASGNKKWETDFGGGRNLSTPAIGPDETIYDSAGDNEGQTVLAAFDPDDGSKYWEIDLGESGDYGSGTWDASPVVSEDGTIYIAVSGKLYSVDTDGSINWFFDGKGGNSRTTPAIDNNGNIIYVSYNPSILYIVSPEGDLAYKPLELNTSGMWSAPVIDDNGIIYIGPDYDEKLYAIEVKNITGPAPSPAWPMLGKNQRRTANAKD